MSENVMKAYDGCLSIFNVSFGRIMDFVSSFDEAVQKKIIADIDAKLRAGDFPDDPSIQSYIASIPELAAKTPVEQKQITKDIKVARDWDLTVRNNVKKARDYHVACEKQKALDNKIDGAEPLTAEEERLVKLSMFENLSKAELKQKIDAINQKELDNQTKAEADRVPLTQEEKDLKEFNEIKRQETFADKRVAQIEQSAQKAGQPKEDYWSNLEESNQLVEQMKEDYEQNYQREKEDINQPTDEKDKPAEKQDDSVLKDATYAAKKEPEFTDPETIDWGKFREEVIWKNLQNIGKQGNIADMGFAMFTTLFLDMAADAINNLVKQSKEIKKANDKKKKDLRDNTIDGNLKDNNLTRETFARLLAVEAKNWIMDTSYVQGIDLSDPSKLTPAQKFAVKKAEFVHRLPKTENGDIDFSKMSKSQQAQYNRYLVMYANSSKWLQKSDQILGVRVTKKELATFIVDAEQAKPKAGLQHVYEDVHVDKKAPKREAPVKVDAIDKDVIEFVDKLENGRALTATEQKMLGNALKNRGFSKEDVKNIQTTFAQQAKGTMDKDGNPIKPSEELRQAVLDVIVKGGLDNYVVTGALSKTQITPRDQAMIALQVEKAIKRRKGLKDRLQQLNALDHQLAEVRNRAVNANEQQIQMQRGNGRS